MSGAEAAGLAVGVIALASLFTTCVELMDYVELGKNYPQDYKLTCTKINILHTRLSIWGDTAHILRPGSEQPLLLVPAKREAVGASLQSLKDVLSDTDILRRKYNLATNERFPSGANGQACSQRAVSWTLLLRRRTTWSIRDKARLDKFIEDISFLMSNLEKVTESLGPSEDIPQKSQGTRKTRHATGMNIGMPLRKSKVRDDPSAEHEQVKAKDEHHKNSSAESVAGTGKQPSSDDSKRSSKVASDQTSSVGGSFLEFSDCVQNNHDNSAGVMGTVGHHTGRINFLRTKQHNFGAASGVLGAISDAAFVNSRKATFGLESSDDDD